MSSVASRQTTIAVDCRMIAHSGIGNSLFGCLRALSRRRTDWQFSLFGSPTSPRLLELVAQNVTIRRLDAPIYSIAEQWAWSLESLRATFDLLWVPHYNIPLLWRGRLVATVHDVGHVALRSVFGSAIRTYASIMLNGVARQADGTAFVSEFTASEFRRYFGPPDGISAVVPNGVGTHWAAAFAEGTVRSAQPYFVAVGNVKPHKNLLRLVQAFGLIADRIPHDLVLIGKNEGFLTGDRAAGAAAERFGERIRFTGWVSDEELIRLVAGADLLVQPSVYEGFGLPPLEAMTVGCPVAVSSCSALPEVCADAAVYFDPLSIQSIADVVLAALLDRRGRSELSARGRARSILFDWDNSGLAMENLMRQVLACPARA
jgi:glycosyltransferase involved in cell wall biosynthesis